MDGSGHDDSASPIMAGGGEEQHPTDTVPADPQAGPSMYHAYLLLDLFYRHSSSSSNSSSSYVIQALPASFEEYERMIGDGDDHEYHIHNHHDIAYNSAVPASEEAIAGLAEASAGETIREAEYAVCLEGLGFQRLQEGDKIRKMPCSHCFHERCIFQWLRVSRVCPCCRFELPAAAAANDVEMGTESEHESDDNDEEEEDYIPYIYR